MNKIELLAPAGSPESFKLAVKAGADAIYLGLAEGFNARMKADNFNIENIEEYIKYAHIFNVKVYVTVNILINDDEFDNCLNLIFECFNKGVDAFIIQDLGLVSFLRKNYPNIPIHISTQAGVNNTESAYFYSKLGVKRIVLSRECDFNEIKAIKDRVQTELEVFVHGALCISFSGNCYLSSFAGGNSGNRGQCLQFCRQPYTLLSKQSIHAVNTNKEKYLLSPKDQCYISELKTLIDIGVSSLKIEGRMKRPEYVAQVVSSYRKAIDAIYDNKPLKDSEIKLEINNLKKVYNRGDFSLGYNEKDEKVIYKNVQNHIGLYVGKVLSIEKDTATVSSNQILNPGDGFKFIRNYSYVGSGEFFKRLDIDKYLIKFSGEVKEGDVINITTDSKQLENLKNLSNVYDINTNLSFKGSNIELDVQYNGRQVFNHVYENVVSEAKNAPVSIDSIIKEISKITEKYENHITYDGKVDNIFVRVFDIKEIKRDIISSLVSYFLKKYTKGLSLDSSEFFDNKIEKNDSIKYAIVIRNLDQIDEDIISLVDTVIHFPDEYTVESCKEFTKHVKKAYLYIPPILDEKDIDILNELIPMYEGVSVSNTTGVELAKKHEKKIITNFLFNLFNKEAINTMSNYGEFVYSPELNIGQIKDLSLNIDRSDLGYVFNFGNMPVMQFKHCPLKNLTSSNCSACQYQSGIKYLDGLNNKFELRRFRISRCYFELYNSSPIVYNCNNNFNQYFNFMTFTREEIRDILSKYKNNEDVKLKDFTRGHFNRGVK